MATLMSSFSDLLARASWAQRLGIMFGGKRDLYDMFGYNKTLKHDDFLGKYQRQDVARRVVDAPVLATWSDPPSVNGGETFNNAWQALVKEHSLYHHFTKVDIFAGLGQYAGLLIGFDDGAQLDRPVRSGSPRKVLYFQPYLEKSLSIPKFNDQHTSQRFGMPELYDVDPGASVTSKTSTTQNLIARRKFQAHYTRVLHVADNTFENPVFGSSRLYPIYNVLDDLLKVVGGSAETYWLTANRGMQADVDKDMELDEEDADNLSAEIEEYQHELRRFIRTRGVKINSLGSDVVDPRGVFEVLISLLSAATGIPRRVLMGAEAGQLASQQDRANWSVRISERVQNFAEPVILRPFIWQMVEAGVLPEPVNLEIDWPDAYKMSPLERAQTSAQMARSAANVAKALATTRKEVGQTVFSIEEARTMMSFGKHMPVFTGLPEGTMLQKSGEGELDGDPPVETGPFGNPPPGNVPPTKPKT